MATTDLPAATERRRRTPGWTPPSPAAAPTRSRPAAAARRAARSRARSSPPSAAASSSSPSPSPRPRSSASTACPSAGASPRGAEVFTGWLGSLLQPLGALGRRLVHQDRHERLRRRRRQHRLLPALPDAAALRRRDLRRQPADHRHRHLAGSATPAACGCSTGSRAGLRRRRSPAAPSIYLAIGPLSFFLQAVYTESLFLLLSLACFVFAREGRWRLAGFMGLLATLTRSTGVLLLIPMVVLLLRAARLEAAEAPTRTSPTC